MLRAGDYSKTKTNNVAIQFQMSIVSIKRTCFSNGIESIELNG